MANLIVILAMTLPSDVPPDVDSAQLIRLVRGQLADFRDVTLVYEGDLNYVGPASLLNEPAAAWKKTYQGIFRFRSDGASFLDVYLHKHDSQGNMLPLIRQTIAYADHVKTSSIRIPDLKRIVDESNPSGPSCLFNEGSFGRVFFPWYFLALKEPLETEYSCLGWEKVDGRVCLKVRFKSLAKVPDENIVREVFWIDVERGANPLKHESFAGTILLSRVDEIKLGRFDGRDGKKVWLPVDGRYLSFGFGGRPDGKPLFVETYAVVAGSVRVNEGLSNSDLSIKAKADVPGAEGLAEARRETETIVPPPAGGTDPVSVKARLDAQLKEADRQSKQIEASSPARTAWPAASIAQVALVAAGLAIAIGGLAWKARRG